MKKTKILATYGPAIASEAKLSRLVKAGVNAFRINCSHGTTSDFEAATKMIRAGTSDAAYPIGLLFDISGPKLRLSRFEGNFEVIQDQEITLTAGDTNLEKSEIGVNHKAIINSLKKNQKIFIDDGLVAFSVISVSKGSVKLKAQNSGVLTSGKGINLPDSKIDVPTIGSKDKTDLATAARVGADFVALSFVRSGDDIIAARRILKKHKSKAKIIAKLEKREAIEALHEIMLLADGVMIARGDLGVELRPEELPALQKRIIRLANQHHKPVIVATQMLESMRFSPRATRAEVNDVASAVYDYADAVMLSAETATGEYPLQAVKTMASVINETEIDAPTPPVELDKHLMESPFPYAIAGAVSQSSKYVETSVIFAFTTSGYTAGLISNLFPTQPVIALTSREEVMRQLSLYRSVYALKLKHLDSLEEMLQKIKELCLERKLASRGEKIIITGGVPIGATSPTNFMMYQEV